MLSLASLPPGAKAVSGQAVVVQAIAENADNQPATSYTGTAKLSISGGSATLNGTALPASVTFSQGKATFSLLFTMPSGGSPTLTLTDGGKSITGSITVPVAAVNGQPLPPMTSRTAPPSQTTSANWAGYTVVPTAGSVTAVSGSWTVPAVSGSGYSSSYSSVWVGIDGATRGAQTVEQIGTGSDVVVGQPHYYIWYEVYPQAIQTVSSLTVAAGDAISASVQYVTVGPNAGQFELSITDTTESNKTFTTYCSVPSAPRTTAEWIVEDTSAGGALPLADFNSVTFRHAAATINGVTGPIDSAGWNATRMNMVSGSTLLATAAPLSDSGGTSSFIVNRATG